MRTILANTGWIFHSSTRHSSRKGSVAQIKTCRTRNNSELNCSLTDLLSRNLRPPWHPWHPTAVFISVFSRRPPLVPPSPLLPFARAPACKSLIGRAYGQVQRCDWVRLFWGKGYRRGYISRNICTCTPTFPPSKPCHIIDFSNC